MSHHHLPPTLRLGPVSFTVTDLDRSIRFYQDDIGLRVHERDDADAMLGDGELDLLALTEEPDARPAGRHAGLYHVAIRYPTRAALADAYRRLRDVEWPIRQATDHGTHEAIYLSDPDGNDLELMWDRPPDQWPHDDRGHISAVATKDLDLDELARVDAEA